MCYDGSGSGSGSFDAVSGEQDFRAASGGVKGNSYIDFLPNFSYTM